MDHTTYKLLDSGNFQKYEQVGPYRLIRPSLTAVWQPKLTKWDADARFIRNSSGDGHWKYFKQLPKAWQIDIFGMKFVIKLTDFGHFGLFPEHHQSESLADRIRIQKEAGKEFKVLNLFAYTGAVSLFAAQQGAKVVHVDASKVSVAWAQENMKANSEELSIRYMVDDVQKFVSREVRRGSVYQGIVLDPPSFGRGPKGQLWKIEDHITDFLSELKKLMSDDFSFLRLSAHTPGFTPIVLENLLGDIGLPSGTFNSFEMTVEDQFKRPLPSGACSEWLGAGR